MHNFLLVKKIGEAKRKKTFNFELLQIYGNVDDRHNTHYFYLFMFVNYALIVV